MENLLKLLLNEKITKDEYIFLTIVYFYKNISLNKILNSNRNLTINIQNIQKLENLNLIEVDYKKNIISESIYFQTINNSNSKINTLETNDSNLEISNNNLKNNELESNELESDNLEVKKLTMKDIDNIRILLNREIKPFELEKLKNWYEQYEMKDITAAIYAAALKNIDNFNYIEKILMNSQNSLENQNTKNEKNENNKEDIFQRNFDFFK